jgi:hypothetical protein
MPPVINNSIPRTESHALLLAGSWGRSEVASMSAYDPEPRGSLSNREQQVAAAREDF